MPSAPLAESNSLPGWRCVEDTPAPAAAPPSSQTTHLRLVQLNPALQLRERRGGALVKRAHQHQRLLARQRRRRLHKRAQLALCEEERVKIWAQKVLAL
jgi:hypothetical protein